MDKLEQKAMKEMEKEFIKKDSNNVINFFKDNITKFMVLLMSLVYIFYGLFLLRSKDRTIAEILGSIAVSVIMGTTIGLCLRIAGLSDARRHNLFKKVVEEFKSSVDSIADHSDKLPAYCNLKNQITLEQEKKRIIENNFLNYKNWKKGFYDDELNCTKLTTQQKVALKVVNKVKIKGITPSDLVNSSVSLTDKERKKYGEFGKSESDYKRQKTISGIVMTLLFSIVFGYFGLDFVYSDSTIATLVWNLFQVIMWVGNGVIKYIDAKSFIFNEYCEQNLRKKIGFHNEFKSIIKNNPALLNAYSDDIESKEEISNDADKQEQKDIR